MKKCSFIILLILYFLPTKAEKINVEKAEKVALGYIQSQEEVITRSTLNLVLVHTEFNFVNKSANTRSMGAEATYYVFSKGNDEGFIIVSADDVAVPVLAYVESGNYQQDNSPPNFAYWMEYLSNEISYAVENRIAQSPEVKARWENYLNGKATLGDTESVAPLLQTKWNQNAPYWDLCPKKYYTGCTATAMAQIVKRYNYPETRTVDIPGYTTNKEKIEIPTIPGMDYDWKNMRNEYNASSSSPEKLAVATLMFHCGAAAKMDYIAAGSAAFVKDAGMGLIQYFDYDKGMRHLQRNYYTNSDWEDILKAELKAGRSMLYAGYSDTSGHAFACDGYNGETGMFHFNWGWGGWLDGDFVSSILNPGKGGIGAGDGAYNNNQEILANIKPNAGGIYTDNIILRAGVNLTAEKTTLEPGESFKVIAPRLNSGLRVFKGTVAIAIVDKNDQIIVPDIGRYVLNTFAPGSMHAASLSFSCIIPETLSAGDYYLRAVSKANDGDTWTISIGSLGYKDKEAITVKADVEHKLVLNDTSLSSTVSAAEKGEEFKVAVRVKNTGTDNFVGDVAVALVDDKDKILEIIGYAYKNVSLQPEANYSVKNTSCMVTQEDIQPGQYKLRVVARITNKNWAIVYGSTSSVIDKLPFTLNSVIQPSVTAWLAQGTSTEWNNAQNWTKGIPGADSKVTIPSSTFYPILTEKTEVGDIYFEAGAELGRQDLLTYGKAFVDYDFGKGARSTHFRMLAIPLMEAYYGDFTFGGQPDAYIQTLQVDESGRGKWVTMSGENSTQFLAGTGFVLSLDPDKDADKGLGLSGGILRLPFFDDASGVDSQVHPNHTYNAWMSTFSNPYGVGSYNVTRSANAYHLAGADVSVNPKFGQSGGNTFALVGNPFMSTIDFNKLQLDNNTLIKNSYQIWAKEGEQEGYAGYSPDGNWGLEVSPELDNLVAPLQGLVVEQKSGGTGSLNFNLPNIATDKSGTLRNTVVSGNKIDIVAQNGKGSVRTFIAKREGGSVQFSDRDARKLINSLTDVPEIYTLKSSEKGLVAVGANIFYGNDVEYPLGLATSYTGDITFTFSGMDNFDLKVTFVDNVLNKTIGLTGLSNYQYTFNYTPEVKGGEVFVVNDRFSLRLASGTSSVEEELYGTQFLNIYIQGGHIHALSTNSSLIKEFKVYSLHGAMVYYKTGINSTSYATKRGLNPGVYIVEVKTEKGIGRKKIIITNHFK